MRHAQRGETNRMGRKNTLAMFAFEIQTFQLLQDFVALKPIGLLSQITWIFHSDQFFLQNGRPTA